ncbi:MAG: enoyl-CoA hydratase [Myxococcota bacterium]
MSEGTNRLQLDTDKMIAEKEGGIGWVIYNNPARHNAMSMEMQQAIPVILEDFKADPEVRVVVIRGAGEKAFISGADISEFESRRSSPEAIRQYNATGGAAGASYATLDKPVIAMIQGFCMGGGLAMAMQADIRIAAEESQFGIPAARLGLGYGFGGVKALVNLVGPAYAAEILFSARRFSAEEALRMGLINRVVPKPQLEPAVRELAATIAGNAPLTVKASKAAIREAVKDRENRDLERVEQMVRECFESQDYIEGRRSFMEKRKPEFRGA